MDDAYAVIMAGGKGERLRPLSTPERPKQFLRLLGDRSMLQETVARIVPSIFPMERTLVVTPAEHVPLVREQLPDLPEANLLAEPFSRGTAPCVALSALAIRSLAPRGVMAALPVDHVIGDQVRFRALLEGAIEVAAEGAHLLTFGIPPDRPETRYGYVRVVGPSRRSGRSEGLNPMRAESFTEKPDLETAKRFLREGNCYWNSGIFVWRVDTILEEIRAHLVDVHGSLAPLERLLGQEPEFKAALQEAYERITSQSIERGVMEKSQRILLVAARDIGWNDIGDWTALGEILAR